MAACGRYYRTADKQAIAEYFSAEPAEDASSFSPGYNIPPTTTAPVIRQNKDSAGRELVGMRWGLVGFGSHGPDPKRTTFNARAEGLEKSSIWRRPLHTHRYLIPVSGFYEWRKSDRKPFRFSLEEVPLYAFAGF
jgi:putative SOS response-associated peptidase YedK